MMKMGCKSLTATLDAMQVMEQFHIVAELYDGLSAIRYIKEQQPDLAFVDVRLLVWVDLRFFKKQIDFLSRHSLSS